MTVGISVLKILELVPCRARKKTPRLPELAAPEREKEAKREGESESEATPGAEDESDTKAEELTADEALQRVWHQNIASVSYPFLFLGFPVHLLLGNPGEPKRTWSDWLWGVLLPKNLFSLLLTVPLFCYSLIVLLFSASIIWDIFQKLVIQGIIDWDVIFNFTIVSRTIPAVLPLAIVWGYGHTLRNLITSYDRFRDEYLQCVPEQTKKSQLVSTPPGIGLTIIAMYVAVMCTHIIPVLTGSFVVSSYLDHWVDVLYSFTLPFYYAFVAGLRSQFQLLNAHLRELVVENERPTLERLANLKLLYKRITRQVVYVNDVFGLYMSWAFPAYAYTIGVNILFVILYLAGIISLTTLVGYMDVFENTSPVFVRTVVANLFVFALYLGLVCYIVWAAIKTNDECRYAQILMNDYLLDKDRDPPALLVQTDEVYKSARHLKYILQETTKKANPALLRLLVAIYLPWVNARLHSHDLHHVVVHGRFLKEIV